MYSIRDVRLGRIPHHAALVLARLSLPPPRRLAAGRLDGCGHCGSPDERYWFAVGLVPCDVRVRTKNFDEFNDTSKIN